VREGHCSEKKPVFSSTNIADGKGAINIDKYWWDKYSIFLA
jgi:hypothetical protein